MTTVNSAVVVYGAFTVSRADDAVFIAENRCEADMNAAHVADWFISRRSGTRRPPLPPRRPSSLSTLLYMSVWHLMRPRVNSLYLLWRLHSVITRLAAAIVSRGD